MQGEDLQGLGLKDLNKLETIIESGLAAVVKTKGERMLKEISALKEKIMGTCVEETRVQDHWSFHRSLELTISNPSSRDPSHNQNYSGSDTCLKLGLPFSN
ncbi:MADS-box protein AGL24-like isoform X2 [Bidens hawaiensis]|uniref:MADS-box protein AGL24-like isoform X2 n=1 Tax=Bidens hawaiensis TaxID=980011 RepID=UPI0040491352